jgi:hypothetical protein
VAIIVSLTAFSLAGACTAEQGTPRRRAELFYDAIADGRLDAARACLVEGAGLRALERRFGSFAAWATRATKNETVMRAEVLGENVEAERARVEMVLLFNDGTRRHDIVELVRGNDAWKVDPRSLPGAERPRTSALRRRRAARRRDTPATEAAA